MSKFIFQVSKFNASKNRLFLKQRYNKAKDAVTSLATLYMDANTYVSGMHYAYIDDDGDTSYSFDKKDEVSVKVDVTINFNPEQLETVKYQLAQAGSILTNPPQDDNGVSELRGWQLHVVIKPNEEITYIKEREEQWGDKLIYKVQPYQVKEVKLVTASEEAYIEAPGASKIDLNMAMQALYSTREKVEVAVKPTTIDEAKSVLLDFSKAKSRGERRRQKREGNKTVQTSNAADAIQQSTQKVEIVLVDEDEDKPE